MLDKICSAMAAYAGAEDFPCAGCILAGAGTRLRPAHPACIAGDNAPPAPVLAFGLDNGDGGVPAVWAGMKPHHHPSQWQSASPAKAPTKADRILKPM